MGETTKVDLAELRRLAEAATPTEGATLNRYEHGGGRLLIDRTQEGGGRQLIADFYGEGADREFYAAANPATILALIASLEKAEAENARLREALPELLAAVDAAREVLRQVSQNRRALIATSAQSAAWQITTALRALTANHPVQGD